MSFSKVIPLGSAGSLTLSESAGIASVELAVSTSLDGGAVTASAGAKGEVSAIALAEALFDLIESKSPAGVVVVEEEIKKAALALLAKV